MIRTLERLSALGVAAALFAMVAITVVDVLGRKLLDASLPGATELTELAMFATIFAGLPLASRAGEHVVFDLLDGWLPAGARRVQHLLAHVVCAATFAGAAWLVWLRAARTFEFGDTTAYLHLPLGGVHQATAVLLGLAAAAHALGAFDALRGRGDRSGVGDDDATSAGAAR